MTGGGRKTDARVVARSGAEQEDDVMPFETRRSSAEPDAIAPDGSEVRLLCGLGRGGMAVFTLAPDAVAKAVAHRTVEEIWYVAAGHGRLWRRLDAEEATTELVPGVSVGIPTDTHFQFRADGPEPLVVIGVTMPPWPGADEAYPVAGPWPPTV
jgi:mannose-6-phosphate isomerase-like protein (cupin superfamily)